jgi:KDO2-lipid IV(A) lauroyltransferase
MKFRYRRYFLYYLGRAAAFLIYLLPLRAGLRFGAFGGSLAFRCLPKYRKAAIENLKYAFGAEKTDEEIKDIAKRVFESLGMTAMELVNFPKINSSNIDDFVTIKNVGILEAAFAKGKGVIVLTGHFGNWELLAMTLRVKGHSGIAIGRKLYFRKYDEYLNRLRKLHDVNIIYRDESPKKVLRVLKDNRIVGILADQDVDSVDGVFVDFFGRPAYTPAGPVALAKASGATLIPAFVMRKGGRHEIVFEDPVDIVDTGDKERDLVRNTQAWSDIFESYVRRHPDHWVWMHRRWKTRPSDDARQQTGVSEQQTANSRQ